MLQGDQPILVDDDVGRDVAGEMFWLPRTKLEWTLLLTAVVVTIGWLDFRGELDTSGEYIWALRLPPFEGLAITAMWLIYGFCRVQLRDRQNPG